MSARPTNEELSGMTINERLWACDLFDRYRAAAVARKRNEMIAILCEVALTKEQAEWSADTVLADPAKYDF